MSARIVFVPSVSSVVVATILSSVIAMKRFSATRKTIPA
jgi:hypothetical protein